MRLCLIRHGVTEYNREKRYQGKTDVPLSAEGRAALCEAPFAPERVYVSPLCRAVETAQILFPQARLIPVPELEEMNFGVFEGRNYQEMEQDAQYRAWVAGNCEGRCPGGESRAEFTARTCTAAEKLIEDALCRRQQELVIVAHGGTQMALLEKYGVPRRDYYQWQTAPGCGFLLDVRQWDAKRVLQFISVLNCTENNKR